MAMSNERSVAVWDLPTRLFHWSLLALVLVAWFTGEEEGVAAQIHRYAGEAIAGLIVFRLIWGFVGGEHARFADFAAGPSAIIAHVRDLMSAQPKRHLGHNPLGGVAVFLLLTVVASLVVTGLFSEDGGPLAGMWGMELSDLHEPLFRVLQVLVVLHVIGVMVESWKAKDALTPAMFTGRKQRRPEEAGADAKKAGIATLLVAAGAGLLSTVWLASLPVSEFDRGGYSEAGEEEHEERGHDD